MATEKSPAPMGAVTPHLVCKGAADAIEFYKEAFGAVEEMRMPTDDGKLMHACIRINGAAVMLADEFPDWGSVGPNTLKGTPVTIHLIVDNADKFVERAVKAGATVTMPVDDAFWGDRYGQIRDPFGHRWSVAHPVRDMSPDEMQKAMKDAMKGMTKQCA